MTIEIVRIEKNEYIYQGIFESYEKIYNHAMVRGRGTLKGSNIRFVGGKPVQLDINNFNPLLTEEYVVNAKADGERFLLMIGEKEVRHGDDEIGRNIYLINGYNSYNGSNINIWKIFSESNVDGKRVKIELPSIKGSFDNCLFDGELLFFGKVQKQLNENNEINRYIIKDFSTKNKSVTGSVVFLLFDILYGPTHPAIQTEKREITLYNFPEHLQHIPYEEYLAEATKTYDVSSSGSMFGFKGMDMWPTIQRLDILNRIYYNEYSPLITYLRQLNMHSFDFMILLSPIKYLGALLESSTNSDEIYNNMRRFFIDNMRKQINSITSGKSHSNIEYFDEEEIRYINDQISSFNSKDKTIQSIGAGFTFDGLILTPAHKPYLMDTWSIYDNIQYKWKPLDELTIDVQVGVPPPSKQQRGDIKYYYAILTRNKDANNQNLRLKGFNHKEKQCIIQFNSSKGLNSLLLNSIVEVRYLNEDESNIYFEYLLTRFDKFQSNSLITIESTLSTVYLSKQIDMLSIIKIVHNAMKIREDSIIESDNKLKSVKEIVYSFSNPFNIAKYYFRYGALLTSANISGANIYYSILDKDSQLQRIYSIFERMINEGSNGSNGPNESNGRNIELEFQIRFKDIFTKRNKDLVLNPNNIERFIYPIINKYFKGEKKDMIITDFVRIYSSDQKESTASKIIGNKRITAYILDSQLLIKDITDKKEISDSKIHLADILSKNLKYDEFSIINQIEKDSNGMPFINMRLSEEIVDTLESDNQELQELINTTVERSDTSLTFNYQRRYTINFLSDFWVIDIIENGRSNIDFEDAKNVVLAGINDVETKKNYKVRIEIEYSPLDYINKNYEIFKELYAEDKEANDNINTNFVNRTRYRNALENLNEKLKFSNKNFRNSVYNIEESDISTLEREYTRIKNLFTFSKNNPRKNIGIIKSAISSLSNILVDILF